MVTSNSITCFPISCISSVKRSVALPTADPEMQSMHERQGTRTTLFLYPFSECPSHKKMCLKYSLYVFSEKPAGSHPLRSKTGKERYYADDGGTKPLALFESTRPVGTKRGARGQQRPPAAGASPAWL